MNENKENAATLARMEEVKSLIKTLGEAIGKANKIREEYEAQDRRAQATDNVIERLAEAIDEACKLHGYEFATLMIDGFK